MRWLQSASIPSCYDASVGVLNPPHESKVQAKDCIRNLIIPYTVLIGVVMIKKFVLLSAAALLLAGSGCNGTGSGQTDENTVQVRPDEPISIGQTWLLNSDNPLDSNVPWMLTSAGVSETVYMLDKNGNPYSRFVEKLEKTGELSWNAVLKDGPKFSDGSPVSAQAVCAALNDIMAHNKFSNATAGVIQFTPTGELTFDIKTERPCESMKSILAEWTNVIFKTSDGQALVFTGPYIIKTLDADNELVLEPNPHYPEAEKRVEVVIKLFKDETAMRLAYTADELDMAFMVTPEVAEMLQAEKRIVKTIEAGYQYFCIVNIESDILDDIRLRKALNAGLNREDYIRALRGGRVPRGIFASYYTFAGNCRIKYDRERAKKLLDEAGWLMGNDGIREKDGKRLELKLLTYPSRPDLSVIMQIMALQLQELGIKACTKITSAVNEKARTGEFDLILYATHTAPTGDPSFFLNRFFRSGEAENYSRYNSAAMNALLKEMESSGFGTKTELAKKAQDIIFEDLPVLYLVDPQWHIALSERLKDYRPYCGDYYIVNTDLGIR